MRPCPPTRVPSLVTHIAHPSAGWAGAVGKGPGQGVNARSGCSPAPHPHGVLPAPRGAAGPAGPQGGRGSPCPVWTRRSGGRFSPPWLQEPPKSRGQRDEQPCSVGRGRESHQLSGVRGSREACTRQVVKAQSAPERTRHRLMGSSPHFPSVVCTQGRPGGRSMDRTWVTG